MDNEAQGQWERRQNEAMYRVLRATQGKSSPIKGIENLTKSPKERLDLLHSMLQADEIEPGIPLKELLFLDDLREATEFDGWTVKDGWENLYRAPEDCCGVEIRNGHVVEIHLKANNLRGVLPGSVGFLGNCEKFVLSQNMITGDIPPEIGQCRALQYLDISSNCFHGEIPPEIGNMVSLNVLILSYNMLQGRIPPDMLGKPETENTPQVPGCKNLQAFGLKNNRFIPDQLMADIAMLHEHYGAGLHIKG